MIYDITTKNNHKHIDQLDHRICHLLAADTRIKLTEIAEKLNIDPRIVRYRIKKLERSGLILGYFFQLNLPSVGRELIELNISLQDLTVIPEIINFFDRTKACLSALEIMGKYDLTVELAVTDDGMLRDIMQHFRREFLMKYIYFDNYHLYNDYIMNWYPLNGDTSQKNKDQEDDSHKDDQKEIIEKPQKKSASA